MGRFFIFIIAVASWLLSDAMSTVTLPVEKSGLSRECLQSMIWDATKVPTNECYGSGYISVAPDGLVKESLGEYTELYRRRDNRILWRGFTVGRYIGCLVDSTVMYSLLPLDDGGGAEYKFSAKVKSHDIFLYEMSGSCSSRLCANGRFIISPGDTIPANLMIESRRYIVAVDGHLPADTTTVQFYRWYATGEDIPFAVQVRREGYSECLFMISEITEKLTDSDDDDYGGDDAAKVRELLDNIKVSVGHDTVSISLGQFYGSCAEAYLVDIPGNIHGCTSSRLDEQENIIDIPLYGLPAGTYMLVVIIDDNPEFIYKQILSV